MSDIIERLRKTASRGVSVWGDLQMEAADEIETLRGRLALPAPAPGIELEVEDLSKLVDRLGGILSRTAIALRGPEPPLTRWSWHDLPELVDALKDEIAVLRLRPYAAQPVSAPAEVAPPGWRDALQFYADGNHFNISGDPSAWDTTSGEPTNFWCDEAGTATMEDGTVAKMALAGTPLPNEDDDDAAQPVPAVPHGMVLVTRDDANNYCRILTVLGMEEEGDPVAEIVRLQTPPPRAHLGNAPEVLNTGDKAMWATGWNDCRDGIVARQGGKP